MTDPAEARRRKNERRKERMASDPEFAARQREQSKAAKKKYRAKKRFERDSSPMAKKSKPGRIVSLCGWCGW
jgi:hypothetical protein